MGKGRKIFELFGSIVVEGLGDSKKAITALNKDIRATNKVLNKMGRDAAKMGKTITTGITAPVVALTSSMVLLSNATGKYADQLLDLQQITGLSTDNLQGLEVIAEEAGVSFTGLTNTIAKFTSKIPELAKGTGASSDAMDQLGISAFDGAGKIKDMNELFPEMINRLQGMEDITERNAISQQLFGKSLGDIAPVLSLSKDRFNELLGSAENLSGFMSEDAIKSANDYRVMMEKLKREFGGFFRELSMNVIPIISETLVPLLRDTVFPIIKGLVGVVGDLADWFNNLATPVKEFAVIFGTALAIMGPMLLLFAKFLPLIKGAVLLYKVLTGAQVSLNLAMSANPIGLIVVGIAALIAAGVLLWKNWGVVKEKFVDTWDFIFFHFKNIATKIAILYAKMYLGILEGINKIGKFIPGLNKGLSLLIGTIKKGVNALEAQTDARKALRKEQIAAINLTRDEAEAAKEAKKLTDESIEASKKELAEKEKAAKKKKALTLQEIEDAKKLAKERTKFEGEWTKTFEDSINTRTQALEAEKQAALAEAKRLGADKQKILDFYANEEIKLNKQVADENFKNSQSLITAQAELEEGQLAKLQMITQQKLDQNEFEKTEAIRIANEKGLDIVALTALYKAREDTINADSAVKEIKIAQTVKNKRVALAQQIMQQISTVANGISSIWQDGLNKRIQELDTETEAKKEAIENSLLSEEEKATQIAAIDEEMDAKKLELQKENAQREKLLSIMNITLSIAQGIAASIAMGGPAGIIMGAITGALGAAQLAMAVATPIPFAEGGLVKSSPGKGIIAQIGEGTQDEVVLPMKTGAVEIAKGIISAMGGGLGGGSISSGAANVIEYHFHTGIMIANDMGVKKFAKEINKHIVSNNQRTGVA